MPSTNLRKLTAADLAVNPDDVATAVRQHMMLAVLRISSWSGVKTDKRAVEDVRQANNVGPVHFGDFKKKLLAGSEDQLKAVLKIQGAARNAHMRRTLPWAMEGARLLPAKSMYEYLNEMKLHSASLQPAVDDFVNAYDNMVMQAKSQLGALFDPKEYPTRDEVGGYFKLDVQLHPIPAAADWRQMTGLPENALKQLGQQTVKKIQEAMRGCVLELRARARGWAERCDVNLAPHPDDPGKPAHGGFHATFLTDLARLARDLDVMNVVGDLSITEIQKLLAGAARTYDDVEALKGSRAQQEDLRETALEILRVIQDYEAGEQA